MKNALQTMGPGCSRGIKGDERAHGIYIRRLSWQCGPPSHAALIAPRSIQQQVPQMWGLPFPVLQTARELASEELEMVWREPIACRSGAVIIRLASRTKLHTHATIPVDILLVESALCRVCFFRFLLHTPCVCRPLAAGDLQSLHSGCREHCQHHIRVIQLSACYDRHNDWSRRGRLAIEMMMRWRPRTECACAFGLTYDQEI